jgi:hypothetical protein
MVNNRRRNRNTPPRRRRANNNYGPSRADTVVQAKELTLYGKLAIANTVSGLAYGIGRYKFSADSSQTFAHSYMETMADQYEQYRVKRIRIFGMPGSYMTNDIRLKSEVLCRVDPDSFSPGSTASNLGLLAAASNTVTRRLNDSVAGTLIADYQPVCHPYQGGASQSDGRVLPNSLSWMMLRDTNSTIRFHLDEWKGAQLALTMPDEGFSNYPHMQLRFKVDIEFRGRQIHGASYVIQNLTDPKPNDVEEELSLLRTWFLTGEIHPLSGWETVNVANIGISVFGPELIGKTYRVNANTTFFEITSGDATSFGAIEYTPPG